MHSALIFLRDLRRVEYHQYHLQYRRLVATFSVREIQNQGLQTE